MSCEKKFPTVVPQGNDGFAKEGLKISATSGPEQDFGDFMREIRTFGVCGDKFNLIRGLHAEI
jgi:hypothetical protein